MEQIFCILYFMQIGKHYFLLSLQWSTHDFFNFKYFFRCMWWETIEPTTSAFWVVHGAPSWPMQSFERLGIWASGTCLGIRGLERQGPSLGLTSTYWIGKCSTGIIVKYNLSDLQSNYKVCVAVDKEEYVGPWQLQLRKVSQFHWIPHRAHWHSGQLCRFCNGYRWQNHISGRKQMPRKVQEKLKLDVLLTGCWKLAQEHTVRSDTFSAFIEMIFVQYKWITKATTTAQCHV